MWVFFLSMLLFFIRKIWHKRTLRKLLSLISWLQLQQKHQKYPIAVCYVEVSVPYLCSSSGTLLSQRFSQKQSHLHLGWGIDQGAWAEAQGRNCLPPTSSTETSGQLNTGTRSRSSYDKTDKKWTDLWGCASRIWVRCCLPAALLRRCPKEMWC